MKTTSLAFIAALLWVHVASGSAEPLDVPLSMFRDGDSGWLGYSLFGLLLAICGLMLRQFCRAERYGDACLIGLVTVWLFLVAVTPSTGGFHAFCSFVVLFLAFVYYAVALSEVGEALMWAHFAVPVLWLAATRFESYGLWQKGIIVYFVFCLNVQYGRVNRFLERRPVLRRIPRRPGDGRRRVIYTLEE